MKEHAWKKVNRKRSPVDITNIWECSVCKAWLTCFNKPDSYSGYGIPETGDYDPLGFVLRDCDEYVCQKVLEA